MARNTRGMLGERLYALRQEAGLSLREVEHATASKVSNVYLSQLETGRRTDPNPRILVALARMYGVSTQELLEAAGYLDPPAPSAVETAYEQVLADPIFKFGTRLKDEPNEDTKRVIIELYEKATKKSLLPDPSDAADE